MRSTIPVLFLVLSFLTPPHRARAQKPGGGRKAGLHGIVYDEAHDSALRSATVAVYRTKDSTLLAYRLTNPKGEFSFDDLPAATPLTLVASFIGFSNHRRLITLEVADVDLGRILMTVSAKQLDAVVVSAAPPPVRMNGDTLEFNSDAFKLDSTAQVEDLVRILPGVTLWMADGSITVNGRKVSSVLVNGKPFFGDDPKIALQNLPKTIVDKIQVYQRVSEDVKSKDSTTILDIKLKKGKDIGHFGRLDAGYGSSGHYEATGNLNFFDKHNQLGVAAITNNTNKTSESVNTILRSSTYKGNDNNVELKSNFTIPGVNTFTGAGLILQHDFNDTPSYRNQNELTGIYYFTDNQRQLKQLQQTVTTVNDSSVFNSSSQSSSRSTLMGHSADVNYDKTLGEARLTIGGHIQANTTTNASIQQSSTTSRDHGLVNQQSGSSNLSGQNDVYSVNASLNKYFSMKPSWNSVYQVDYRVNFFNHDNLLATQNNYTAADSTQNRFINRRTHSVWNQTDQLLSFRLPNLSMLVTGKDHPQALLGGFEFDVKTNSGQHNVDVFDVDSLAKTVQPNSSLTNRQHESDYDLQPGITLGKNWSNSNPKSPPKTYRNLYLNANLTESWHGYQSRSIQAIQNLSRNYSNFTPTAMLAFTQYKQGANQGAHLNYNVSTNYPTLYQLAPLVDSSNPSYIQFGNPTLREAVMQNISLRLSVSRQKSTGGAFSTDLTIRNSWSNRYIAPSTVIDSLGQTRASYVNARGYNRLYISLEVKKALNSTDPKKLQIQLGFLPEFSIDHSPRYVNHLLSYFNNYNVVVTPTLNLSYEDWLTLNLYEREGWARSTQTGQATIPLTNHTSSTTANGWLKVSRSFFLSSNITYTVNTSTASTRQAFTLWNASAVWRFLHDQTGEIKFSALDLLHQNTGLTNYATDNTIVHGDNNIIRQYFLLTIAWHPRRFGKQ